MRVLSWLKPLQGNDFVELFAGMGHVSGSLRDEAWLRCFGKGCGECGFFCSHEYKDGATGVALDVLYNPIALDITTDAGFASALNEIRKLKPGACVIAAICCKSFSAMLLG